MQTLAIVLILLGAIILTGVMGVLSIEILFPMPKQKRDPFSDRS